MPPQLSEETTRITRENVLSITSCFLILALIFSPEFISLNFSFLSTSLDTLFRNESLSQLMQGSSVAVLTLLVSFAIGILIHHLGDGSRNNNFLHLHVALDHVWFFKPTLVVLVVNVVSPFFIIDENTFWNVTFFTVWVTTFAWLCIIVLRLYEWVKGDKDDFIKAYLSSSFKSAKDKIITWEEFWSIDLNIKKRFAEKEFFIPFSQQIDKLFYSSKNEDWQVAAEMIEGFKNSIDKRNKIFITAFDEFFPKILEWHFIIWNKQYGQFEKGYKLTGENLKIRIHEIDLLIDEIIKYVTRESLLLTGHAHSYFIFLQNHIDKYKDKEIVGEERVYYYIDQLPIYFDCLNMISVPARSREIWEHYFPAEWKVTIENFKKNRITRLWYKAYVEWSQERIRSEGDDYDTQLEDVSKELFPENDPIIWAKIYTFVLHPEASAKIKEIIEHKAKFGYIGRIHSGFGENIEEEFALLSKEYFQNTINLAVFLFSNLFTEDNIDRWLNELKKIEYSKKTNEYLKQQSWIMILLSLKEKIKSDHI